MLLNAKINHGQCIWGLTVMRFNILCYKNEIWYNVQGIYSFAFSFAEC